MYILLFLLYALSKSTKSEPTRISSFTTDQKCASGQGIAELKANITAELMRMFPGSDTVCKGEDGWRKILDINMSNPNHNCPQGLTLYTSPFRLCGRTQSTTYDFCNSSVVAVGGQSYTQVCGRVKGYQQDDEYSFYGRTNIEESYLDGVRFSW